MSFSYPQPSTQLYPFQFPGQNVGQWIGYDPTTGAFTYEVAPGFALESLWFPALTDNVQLWVGTDQSVPPFYTTGAAGFECVPLPSGTLIITMQSVHGAGAIMPLFLTSLTFDPSKSTPNEGLVTEVTAAEPVTSTGGSTPVIGLDTPLAVAYGGTGTATPGLIAGSGITITGTWPNNTLAVVGGTVTAVTASSPLASSGGSTPNISLLSPLGVSNGGTGTSSPSLVGGTGISISGSWPNQTVTSSALPTILGINGSPVSGALHIETFYITALAGSGATASLTFGTAFNNAPICATITVTTTSGYIIIDSISTTGVVVKSVNNTTSDYMLICAGN